MLMLHGARMKCWLRVESSGVAGLWNARCNRWPLLRHSPLCSKKSFVEPMLKSKGVVAVNAKLYPSWPSDTIPG